MPHKPLLTVNKLSFHYSENKLFTDWSATIYPGIALIHGEDGCGKTTLLKLLTGRLPMSTGELCIAGIDSKQQEVSYRKQAFWVDAQSQKFESIRVDTFFSSLRENYEHFSQENLQHAVDGLSLTPHLEKQFFMLSTGTRRKVWLAAALSAECPVIALDDPFAGIDKLSMQFFSKALEQRLEKQHQVWIIATYIKLETVCQPQIIQLT
ncbi:ABC transporter ATP-binding protein [Undibacterium sp. SXout11W]|uniref:ABC transporter ATP-binding protein n=1 Tax=Undibacterium sp. SXout11W TaxID=3413050 RepID=UPI003BF4421B